jgi:hypothetical protein
VETAASALLTPRILSTPEACVERTSTTSASALSARLPQIFALTLQLSFRAIQLRLVRRRPATGLWTLQLQVAEGERSARRPR